jgi:hypothetical protein
MGKMTPATMDEWMREQSRRTGIQARRGKPRARPATILTPTVLGGLTVGNGSWIVEYSTAGGVGFVYGSFTLGSTSAVTGEVKLDYPAPTDLTAVVAAGAVTMLDTSTNSRYSGTILAISSGVLLRTSLISGTRVTVVPVSATVPFTWAAGDVIEFSFNYPLAVT